MRVLSEVFLICTFKVPEKTKPFPSPAFHVLHFNTVLMYSFPVVLTETPRLSQEPWRSAVGAGCSGRHCTRSGASVTWPPLTELQCAFRRIRRPVSPSSQVILLSLPTSTNPGQAIAETCSWTALYSHPQITRADFICDTKVHGVTGGGPREMEKGRDETSRGCSRLLRRLLNTSRAHQEQRNLNLCGWRPGLCMRVV